MDPAIGPYARMKRESVLHKAETEKNGVYSNGNGVQSNGNGVHNNGHSDLKVE